MFLYLLMVALTSAYISYDDGRSGGSTTLHDLFGNLVLGFAWPVTFVTYFPYLLGVALHTRVRERQLAERRAVKDLEREQAEVERILNADYTVYEALPAPEQDKVLKYTRTPSGKLKLTGGKK